MISYEEIIVAIQFQNRREQKKAARNGRYSRDCRENSKQQEHRFP
jgi:hypothetical protein